MRRKGLWLSLAGVAGMALCSSAGAAGFISGITVDGSLADWGVTTIPGTEGSPDNAWAPSGINVLPALGTGMGDGWIVEDTAGALVGPAVGGQNFDVEALYTGIKNNGNGSATLYVALVTGFDIAGETSGPRYFAGDVFIDFGNYFPSGDLISEQYPLITSPARSWDLAFNLGSFNDSTVSPTESGNITTTTITSQAAGPGGFTAPQLVESPQGTNTWGDSGPLRVVGSVPTASNVTFAYTNGGPGAGNGGASDHNIYEFSYTFNDANWLNSLFASNNGGWTVNWTMSCGNDYLSAGGQLANVPSFGNVVPVPAAAPLGLLGMGLLALVRRVRRRPEC